MVTRIVELTAELRSDSPAVDTATPRLSWVIESDTGDWLQDAAELRRTDTATAETAQHSGRDSVLVDWPFAPLAAGERARIEVRARGRDGIWSPWSDALDIWAAFPDRWVAKPIALSEPTRVAQPALFRHEFTTDRPVRTAHLFWTALGVVDVTINGALADDGILAPGWTTYRDRLVHESADVTSLLRPGANVIGAMLAGGWYTEEYHVLTQPRRFYGDQPRFAAQLVVMYEDGSRETLTTQEGWHACPDGPIVSSGIYAGEHVDARRSLPGWDMPGFDDSEWLTVAVSDDPLPVEPRMAPPVRRTGSLTPVAVGRTASGRVLIDFGQNLVGRVRLRVTGERGTTLTLRHAEVLEGRFDESAELALRPLRRASATDSFILAGSGGVEEFEPRFTFHGFRYVDIDGWPGEFDPAAIEAVILGSDLRRTGWFSSSDATLDRFHENVVWTQRGNYLAVPQDCPQRDERLGWTGDTQLFAPTAAFLFDSHAFLRSWLRDLAIEQQRLGGLVPLFAPDVVPDFADRGPVAAWGDAIAIVPAVLADSSGDISLLGEFYPGMRDWVELCLSQRDAEGLWTSGRQLADWLDPNAPPNAPARGRTDTDIVATAYLARTLRLTSEIARALGETADADRFARESAVARAAFTSGFVTPTGRMMCDTQTAYALAIAFDLIDDPRLRGLVGDRLAFVVRRDGYHVSTGLVGTSIVTAALTAAGHVDAAERMMFQTDAPSWLYPVRTGATTIWERWDGLKPDGSLNPGAMVSFNHVALGSVAAWLHRDVTGLTALEPGYRRLRVAPHPLARLTHAKTSHLTPYGRAEAGWERTDAGVRVFVAVPPNTTAVVELPGGERQDVGSGHHEWTVPDATARQSPALTLDSSLAELVDNEDAHRAFDAALDRAPSVFLRSAVRANALYTPGRSIRDALIFADAGTLADVQVAIGSGQSVSATNELS